MASFSQKVYLAVSKIPKGKVSTYKEIAGSVGRPKAVRAVGQVLNVNKNPHKIPCYKVVCSDGSIGGYCRAGRKNIQKKIGLLEKDGIKVEGGKVDLKKHLYKF